MQITLNQSEIERAIINYVGSQGIAITGKNVDVTLIAGRGANGMSASIDISNDKIGSDTVVEVVDKVIDPVVTDSAEEPAEVTTEEDDNQLPLFGN